MVELDQFKSILATYTEPFDNAIIQFQRVTECLWNYSDIWKMG